MEEKKKVKIGLSTFFLIVVIIVIIIMGYYIYNLNQEKVKAEEKVSNQNEEINKLKDASANLQEKIDIISNTINNNTKEDKNKTEKDSQEKKSNFTIEDSNDMGGDVDLQEQNRKKISGKWYYTSAKLNGKEVSLREVFGSGIAYGTGTLTLNSDGTFENIMPGVSSSEIETTGKFYLNKDSLDLEYTNKTEKLIYNETNNTIEQSYDDYVLILERK